MIEKMLKFLMMVAIWLCLFWIIKIFTILDWLQNEVEKTSTIISNIETSLSWLSIDAVILETND